LQNDFCSGAKNIVADYAPTEKIDSQISPFRFHYCPFSPIERVSGDFSNTIGPRDSDISVALANVGNWG
jgi:hypothetical protein